MINWKELNYAKGLERIYDAVWIAMGLIAAALLVGGGIHSNSEYLLPPLFWVGPYFLKKLIIWLYKGFTEK